MKANNASPSVREPDATTESAAGSEWLKTVEQQVNALKFGSVHITVHEGRVVQVETSIRVRFDKA